jgi:predicted protein tyrosine phosphatase
MQYVARPDKWLFICSANVARSPTAEYLARKAGLLARSCGTGGRRGEYEPYTVTPMTQEIIEWADVIVAMKLGHRIAVQTRYDAKVTKGKKFFVWELTDVWHEPYHPDMIAVMEPKLLESVQLYEKWREEKAGRLSGDATTEVG